MYLAVLVNAQSPFSFEVVCGMWDRVVSLVNYMETMKYYCNDNLT